MEVEEFFISLSRGELGMQPILPMDFDSIDSTMDVMAGTKEYLWGASAPNWFITKSPDTGPCYIIHIVKDGCRICASTCEEVGLGDDSKAEIVEKYRGRKFSGECF